MIQLAIIPGDGIGPEVMNEAIPVLEWARSRGRALAWTHYPHGADHYLRTGEFLADPIFEELRDRSDAILFGAVGDPRIPDGRHAEGILLRLRQELRLHVNFRPCHPILDDHVPLKGVLPDSVRIDVFRENTEGLYCMLGETHGDRAVDYAVHTVAAVELLLRAAFEHAAKRGCPLIVAHKANVLKHGHGLWMRVFEGLRKEFPDVRAKGMHADALLCELVQNPGAFGVVAADNFIGDLVSDLLASFQGGMGLAPSGSWAPHRPFRCSALFEPVHGSAPDIAGEGVANPTGMILSTALLFSYLGWIQESEAVERSVEGALRDGSATQDLGGSMSCSEMGAALRARLSNCA